MISITLILAFASYACAVPQNYYGGNQGGSQGGFGISSGGGGGGGGHHSIGQSVVVPILRDNREGPLDGVYSFDFETGDGIVRQESGSPSGPNGAVVQQGSWAFTFPDGTPAQFSFVADEGGYRVDSPLIPTPHPLPAHALEQIEKAERERAQGIIHDGQYRPDQSGQPSRQQQFGGQSQNQQRYYN